MSTINGKEICERVLSQCVKSGADAAEAVLMEGHGIDIQVRNLEIEDVGAHEEQALGLRVFVGQRQANIRSTNLEPDTLERLVEDVVAMAKLAPEDPHAGLADPDQVAKGDDSFWTFMTTPARMRKLYAKWPGLQKKLPCQRLASPIPKVGRQVPVMRRVIITPPTASPPNPSIQASRSRRVSWLAAAPPWNVIMITT